MKHTNKKNKTRYFHYQKEILNTISEPASFIDSNYRYVFVNNAFNKFYGKETNETIGQTMDKLWGVSNFREKLKSNVEKCLSGEPVFIQYKGEIPSGEFKILEMNFYPHRRKGEEKIDGIIATANDITERIKAEEALKKSEARLKELNATKDKLFSIIGHDLKGPLNNILGFSELIEKGYNNYSDKEIRQYNKIIYQLSKSVSELLENLLTWSRSQRQKISMTPQNIAVHFVVEKCFSFLHQNTMQKEIRLRNKIPHDVFVFADEEMITIILRNLLSNAIKFTRRGGTVTVNVKKENRRVVISINDNGVGICQTEINELFNPQENYTSVGTEGEKGTGLGLLICKDLVEKNGGKIWATSNPGEGSVFYFSLPAANC